MIARVEDCLPRDRPPDLVAALDPAGIDQALDILVGVGDIRSADTDLRILSLGGIAHHRKNSDRFGMAARQVLLDNVRVVGHSYLEEELVVDIVDVPGRHRRHNSPEKHHLGCCGLHIVVDMVAAVRRTAVVDSLAVVGHILVRSLVVEVRRILAAGHKVAGRKAVGHSHLDIRTS